MPSILDDPGKIIIMAGEWNETIKLVMHSSNDNQKQNHNMNTKFASSRFFELFFSTPFYRMDRSYEF